MLESTAEDECVGYRENRNLELHCKGKSEDHRKHVREYKKDLDDAHVLL